MLILVSAVPVEWNKSTISYDEVLTLIRPSIEEGVNYLVNYCTIPRTDIGESIDMYLNEKVFEFGSEMVITRPEFYS